MRRVSLLLVGIVVFALAGCQSGIQVHDNMYNALAGQVIKVSDDFAYVGSCDPATLSASNEGRYQVNNGTRTRADVFVRSSDGNPAEVFIIQRVKIIKTGYSWNPTNGDPVEVLGTQYDEMFFDAKRDMDVTVQSYMDFMNQNGYKVDTPDLYVRGLVKNVGKQLQVFLFYGVYPGMIPENVLGDYEKEKQFIRERFDTNISVVQ